MKKRLALVIVIVVVLVLAGVATVSWLMMKEVEPQTQNTAYVDITDAGFVPQTLQITKGTTVIWTNRDAAPHQVASDPYPDRTALPGLFAKQPLAAEQSHSFTFDKAGTFRYHDYLHPKAFHGIVIVKS